MNKKDIVEDIFASTSIKKKDIEVVINEAIKVMQSELIHKGEVALVGFGSFKTVERTSRQTHLPNSSTIVNIPPFTTVTFKPSKKLKAAINETN